MNWKPDWKVALSIVGVVLLVLLLLFGTLIYDQIFSPAAKKATSPAEFTERLLADCEWIRDQAMETFAKKGSCRAAAVSMHHGFGRSLRNELHLWKAKRGERPLKDALVDLGFLMPDDMSGVLLEDLVEFIVEGQHLSVDGIRQRKVRYDAHWAASGNSPKPYPPEEAETSDSSSLEEGGETGTLYPPLRIQTVHHDCAEQLECVFTELHFEGEEDRIAVGKWRYGNQEGIRHCPACGLELPLDWAALKERLG